MKRDWALIKSIMEKLESGESLGNTDEVAYHLLILQDAGYISMVGSHLGYMRDLGTRFLPEIARLTWKGHEYLDGIRATENIRYIHCPPRPPADLDDPAIRVWL